MATESYTLLNPLTPTQSLAGAQTVDPNNLDDDFQFVVAQTETVYFTLNSGAGNVDFHSLSNGQNGFSLTPVNGPLVVTAGTLAAGTYTLEVGYTFQNFPNAAPYSFTISTTAPGSSSAPDLIVSSVTPNAVSVTQGQTFGFSYVIQDNSSAPVTVNTSAGIYLDGQRIKSDAIGAISANSSNPGSDSFSTAGLSVGQHTLTVSADDTQLVNEGNNEGNNTRSLTFNVTAANHAPVANNNSYSVPENGSLAVLASGVLGNDTDQDGDNLTAVLANAPSHGSLTFHADGSFTYTPLANYIGPDSFTYFANDGTTNSAAAATVSITVSGPTNHAPVANNNSYSVPENGSLAVLASGVLGNDSDQDGDNLTAVLASATSHGSLTLHTDGSFTYTPLANYVGPDSFTYFANDGTLNSATAATVSITINAAPTGSVSINDVSIGEGNSGTQIETFTVTRSGGIAAFDVSFATSDNSATVADSDYVANAGMLHFDTNVNTQTISVTINGDTKPEPNETFFVNLTGATNGATISDGQGIGTITNDDVTVKDFNGDSKSDILWRNDNGSVATWDMNDRSSSGAVIASVSNDWHIAGTGDFNGDNKVDILWRNDNGSVATWNMNDRSSSGAVIGNVSNDWHIAGTGDFNGDGKTDILWRNDSGAVATWNMNDRSSSGAVIGSASNDWHIAGTGDFNGDGKTDILWRNDNGAVATWDMNDRSSSGAVIANVSNDWHIAGTGDFNGDGKTDILWRNDSGQVATWDMNDRSSSGAVIATVTNDWHIAGTGDFNGDGKTDILWRNDSGAVATWDMNDHSYSGVVIATVPNDWHIT